jgi:hypothetical protein
LPSLAPPCAVAVRRIDIWTEAEPVKVIEDASLVFGAAPLTIVVFDPKQYAGSTVACQFPHVNRIQHVPEVQRPGRRRCEASEQLGFLLTSSIEIYHRAMQILLTVCILVAIAMPAFGQPAPRARDRGDRSRERPGALNAITDVSGVEVGMTTLIRGEGSPAELTWEKGLSARE